MRYIKLFEDFSGDKVKYFVNKVGDSYRIFALTPKMMSDGLGYKDSKDAEELFGGGTLWMDYPSYESAQKIINSLESDEFEHEDP